MQETKGEDDRSGAGSEDGRGTALRERIRKRGSYGLLLINIVALLIATAIAGRSPVGRGVVVILQGGMLLFALWTSRASRRLFPIALLIVPATVAVAAFLGGQGSDSAAAAVSGAGAVLALAAIAAIARRIVAHARIDAATILGALCVYLLIGILFASVFTTVHGLSDLSFFSGMSNPTSVDFLYFSFVTLTTVGYGDRTAAGDLGRMLAVTEALLGQLYLVTVVALVIGNVGRERNRCG